MALKTDSLWQLFMFSGMASCTAELATVPIDVVKVRMQLQGELGAVQRYRSSLHAFPQIIREEGFLALYKGKRQGPAARSPLPSRRTVHSPATCSACHLLCCCCSSDTPLPFLRATTPPARAGVQPALLRQATYGSLRIGMYEPIKTSVHALVSGTTPRADGTQAPPTMLEKGLSGMLSGALASGLCNPTDVVKVRMQADGMQLLPDGTRAPPRYRGIVHAFGDIWRTEGARGLYKGVSPTVQRAAVVAGVELATYDECKMALIRLGLPEASAVTHLTASIAAGFLCTLASSPLDVVKSRVMNQPVDAQGRGMRYSSTADAFKKSVQAEGVLALWKGFWPNFGTWRVHRLGARRGMCMAGWAGTAWRGRVRRAPLPDSPCSPTHSSPFISACHTLQPASVRTASSRS
jgi:hypothetical protein